MSKKENPWLVHLRECSKSYQEKKKTQTKKEEIKRERLKTFEETYPEEYKKYWDLVTKRYKKNVEKEYLYNTTTKIFDHNIKVLNDAIDDLTKQKKNLKKGDKIRRHALFSLYPSTDFMKDSDIYKYNVIKDLSKKMDQVDRELRNIHDRVNGKHKIGF